MGLADDPAGISGHERRRSPLLVAAMVLFGGSMAFEALFLLDVLHVFLDGTPQPSESSEWVWSIGTTSPSALLEVTYLTVGFAALVCALVLLTQAYGRAGGPDGVLPVRRRWFVLSCLIPVVNLVAPYVLLRFTFDRLLGQGSRKLLLWWWCSWVVSWHEALVDPTTRSGDPQGAMSWPFVFSSSASEIAFNVLTVVVLARLGAAGAGLTARQTSLSSPGSP